MESEQIFQKILPVPQNYEYVFGNEFSLSHLWLHILEGKKGTINFSYILSFFYLLCWLFSK